MGCTHSKVTDSHSLTHRPTRTEARPQLAAGRRAAGPRLLLPTPPPSRDDRREPSSNHFSSLCSSELPNLEMKAGFPVFRRMKVGDGLETNCRGPLNVSA